MNKTQQAQLLEVVKQLETLNGIVEKIARPLGDELRDLEEKENRTDAQDERIDYLQFVCEQLQTCSTKIDEAVEELEEAISA